ncbi:hypothetical protein SAMN05421766_101430 [Zobellia uliginosa]|uniref:Uncharacterized protein n=1 Tax=Zobellia uliginosa TaxID=143224 RepID=A0ABY1KM16_9FLAO|nr:hypothetical protein SAMN05421766_101430 [Zobellia uliginosa]
MVFILSVNREPRETVVIEVLFSTRKATESKLSFNDFLSKVGLDFCPIKSQFLCLGQHASNRTTNRSVGFISSLPTLTPVLYFSRKQTNRLSIKLHFTVITKPSHTDRTVGFTKWNPHKIIDVFTYISSVYSNTFAPYFS